MDEILKNSHRRRILEILYSKKVATPKEISDELGIGVTTVYYHLELMKGLVVKTSRGEYSLTDKGLSLYRTTLHNDISSKTPMGRILPYFIFSKLISSPKLFLPLSIAIGAVEFLVCYTQFFVPYLLGYSRSIEVGVLPWYYLGNIAVLFLFLEVFSYIFTKRVGGELALFNGIMVSRLPLMFALILPILGVSIQAASVITLAIAQLASIGLLSTFLSLSKGIRQETSIIFCLALLYFNLLFFLS